MRSSAAANHRINAKPVVRTAPLQPSLKLVKKNNKGRVQNRFAISILATVLGILALIITPILINTQLAVLSYQITEANIEKANIKEANQELKIKLVNVANPARISKIAIENGLVSSGYSGVIDLQKHAIIKDGTGLKNNLSQIQLSEDKNSYQGVPTPLVNVGDVYNEAKVVK